MWRLPFSEDAASPSARHMIRTREAARLEPFSLLPPPFLGKDESETGFSSNVPGNGHIFFSVIVRVLGKNCQIIHCTNHPAALNGQNGLEHKDSPKATTEGERFLQTERAGDSRTGLRYSKLNF